MKYIIKENLSGLYVGLHGESFCQLQNLEHAFKFDTLNDARVSYNLMKLLLERGVIKLTIEPCRSIILRCTKQSFLPQ